MPPVDARPADARPAEDATSGAGGRSLLDRCFAFRDRLVGDPGFRRWAARFPLTRPIARRRARALFDLCAGFVYSQVLSACVQLRLFDALRDGPLTVEALSRRLSLPPEGTERLLGAAASLRLLARRGRNRFGLGPLGAALVDNPGVTAMIEHHALLYADLRDPVALLRGEGRGEGRGTELSRYWAYAGAANPGDLAPAAVGAYSALMSASQALVAAEVLDAYAVGRHRCLLDVGGGEGAFLVEAAARAPDLRLILFDLPAVAERAGARFAAAGLSRRARVVGGSFLSDPLPDGADAISLVRVVHDHDDAAARAILRAAWRALPPGGTLLLAEPMAGPPGPETVGYAYFGFYLLAMGSGSARSKATLTAMLRDAGFVRVRFEPTREPLLTGLLTARKP